MKKICITLIAFNLLAFSELKSLNLFEFSLIGVGASLVYDQYFDNSLNSQNIYQNKVDIITRFEGDKQLNVNKSYFDSLPIQQKLIVIETLNNN